MSQFTVKWSELANQGGSWESIGSKINAIGQKADSIAKKIDASEKSLAQVRSQLSQYTKNSAYPVAERFRETGSKVRSIADLYARSEGNVCDTATAVVEWSPLKDFLEAGAKHEIKEALKELFKGLKDIKIGNVTITGETIAKWVGPALTVLFSTISNYSEFQNDGGLSNPRFWLELGLESAINIIASKGLEYGINALVPGAGTVCAWAVKWAIDQGFKYFNDGKGMAETISDWMLDAFMPGTDTQPKWASQGQLAYSGGGG